MNSQRSLKTLLLVTAIVVILVAPAEVQADENCCLNNYRFAGGCMVIARGSETCGSILGYLNDFNAVGKLYCDNTNVRGGWTLSDCGDPGQLTPQTLSPQFTQPSEKIHQSQPSIRSTEPQSAPSAQDAMLIQTAAPLQVRFDSTVDSGSHSAGQMVTGHLEQDLMSGDTVIAPAGSEVHFRLVPTSYWTDGGGDAFEIQATAIKVGDTMIPVNATAVAATGEIDTSGAQISVPKGSLVSFETQAADQHAADKRALESGAAKWMEAFAAKDIDAMTAFYAKDAVLLPPDAPAIFGRDAIRASIQEMFVAGLAIELEDLEIEVVGNLGYKAGRYRTRGNDGSLVDRGKYIEIWSKLDGGWVIHRDIWNSSVQPAIDQDDEE
jgi:ketosteroid isomerase-like protein